MLLDGGLSVGLEGAQPIAVPWEVQQLEAHAEAQLFADPMEVRPRAVRTEAPLTAPRRAGPIAAGPTTVEIIIGAQLLRRE